MFRRDILRDGKSPATGPAAATIGWSYVVGGVIQSSPSIHYDGSLYAGSDDGRLYGIGSAGGLLWSYATGAGIGSSPAVGMDVVHVGSDDGILYSIATLSGALSWSYEAGGIIY